MLILPLPPLLLVPPCSLFPSPCSCSPSVTYLITLPHLVLIIHFLVLLLLRGFPMQFHEVKGPSPLFLWQTLHNRTSPRTLHYSPTLTHFYPPPQSGAMLGEAPPQDPNKDLPPDLEDSFQGKNLHAFHHFLYARHLRTMHSCYKLNYKSLGTAYTKVIYLTTCHAKEK